MYIIAPNRKVGKWGNAFLLPSHEKFPIAMSSMGHPGRP